MAKDPLTAGPGDLVHETFERMQRFGIRHLPVVEDGRLVGMVSDRDLRLAVDPGDVEGGAPARLRFLRVRSLMTPHGFTVSPNTLLDSVAWLMIRERIGAVAVVDDVRKVVGLISYVDLLAEAYPRVEAVV